MGVSATLFVGFEPMMARMASEVRDDARARLGRAGVIAATKTALKVRTQLVDSMKHDFSMPTRYTLNSIYVVPATKQTKSAVVGIKEFATKSAIPPAKYLRAEVDGGARRAKRSEDALRAIGVLRPDQFTVPGQGAKLDQYGNMTRGQIVQILSQLRAFGQVGYSANETKASRKRAGQRSRYFVINRAGHLHPGVYRRDPGHTIKPILIFTDKDPSYRIRFDFDALVGAFAAEDFKVELDKILSAWAK